MPKNNQQKISLFLLAIFLLVFVYWIASPTQNQPQSTTPESIINQDSFIISGIPRVIDGDTIEINKDRIRLIKIDAPETKQKCLDKNSLEYMCGEVSTAFLKKLIDGKNVECRSEEKDMYLRYLGDCKLGNIDINYEMVKNGMAVIYNPKDADENLKLLEINAQNKKLGMWQGAFEEPKKYRRKNRHNNKNNNKNASHNSAAELN